MTEFEKRIFGLVTVIVMAFHYYAQPVFAFNLNNLHIRDYFRSQVERSDRFIQNAETKVNQSMQKPMVLITKLTQGGFSLFEKRTGVTENNKLYQVAKNATLRKTGIKLGVAEGTKDFVIGTASLLAQLNTLPARTINLAYNVKERPQEYKEKVITGVTMLAGAMANPKPILRSIQQSWQNTVAEAQKDPLKMGQLQGEIAVFGGTLLLGGGQTKSVTKVGDLLEKVSLPIPSAVYWGATPAIAGAGVGAGKTITAAKEIFETSVYYPLSKVILEKPMIIDSCSLKRMTATDILDWAESTYKGWQKKLSDDDLRVFTDYTCCSSRYNRFLRGTETVKLTLEEKANIYKMSKILSAAPALAEDIVVFRGSTKSILGGLKNLPKEKLVGNVIYDKGFMSTSLIPNQAECFADEVFSIIKVPKGIKGAYIGDLSAIPEEIEFLLDKGQRMKINDVINGKSILILDLEVF